MKYQNSIAKVLCCLIVSASASAAQLTGTVTNATTNKPSAGDEVTLLSLASGMNEVAHTKTDLKGSYSLPLPEDGAQHLVRVTRQSVSYFKGVLPGSLTADVTVYDASTQLPGVIVDARVFHLQASGGNLEVSDLYIVKNESQPPRSRIGNQTFSVLLPAGAQLDHASTIGPSGMPLVANPVPSGEKDRYAFDFPIRPGETRFEVVYKLPYNGQYEFAITPESALSELGILLPKSMKVAGVNTSLAQDSDEGGLAVFFAKNLAANQPVKFSVSGEGVAPEEGAAPPSDQGAALPLPRHGQGNSVWFIVSAVAVLAIGGAVVVWRRRSRQPNREAKAEKRAAKTKQQTTLQAAGPEQGDMLSALKEELFQLETDRLNGKISEEEYQKSKAGLDTLLRRQMKNK